MISGIVAYRKGDRGIGIGNTLPWRIPSDLKHFKKMTNGASVIMGYNTMLSLGKPLPGRKNYVLTRFKETNLPEGFICVQMVQGLRDFIAIIGKRENLWVIGGAKTYEILAPYVERWIITEIDAPGVECDTFFTPVAHEDWNSISLPVEPDPKDMYPYTVTAYVSARAALKYGELVLTIAGLPEHVKLT